MPEQDGEFAAEWQQHYPTYNFKQRDIVLAEYESASKALEAEERLFIGSANFTLLVAAGVSSLALGSLDKLYTSTSSFLSPEAVALALTSLTIALSVLSLRYFADRQKGILVAKRKIVVLRTMLGLSYGRLQLILPNWRFEGANQPFAVKLFPGWSSYVAYPFWIIALCASAIVFFLVAHYSGTKLSSVRASPVSPEGVAVLAGGIWLIVCCILYRSALYDTHERFGLSVSKSLAGFLRVRIVKDIEYVIYRAKLASYELDRLRCDVLTMKDVLVFVEDRSFFTHHGVSLRGILRAIRDLRSKRPSGGSTITQQMARSMFIVDYQKKWRRKLVEIVLAVWAERVFSKQDILRYYLSSVRFANRTFGIAAASRYYLGRLPNQFSKSEAFFLSERIGNVRDRVLPGRIDELLRNAVEEHVLTGEDATMAVDLYRNAVSRGILSVDDIGAFERLGTKWKASQYC